GYNGWAPSEIFQDLSTQDVQRQTLIGNMGWRARPWMQNDATVGVDYSTYTDFNVCRLNECPSYSNLRGGQSFSRTTGARVLNARAASTSTWNARPGVNAKTTVGAEYTFVESDVSYSSGIGLPPGGQNVGQAAGRTGSSSQSPSGGKTGGLFIQEQA